MLKDRLEKDLKTAMLSRDTVGVATLKLIKSAILYKEVELKTRTNGLSDEQVVEVLAKEAKKRKEAAEFYEEAGDSERAGAEKSEFMIISRYLPEQLSDTELDAIIEQCIVASGGITASDMGKTIGAVKARVGAAADGVRIATLVKQKLN